MLRLKLFLGQPFLVMLFSLHHYIEVTKKFMMFYSHGFLLSFVSFISLRYLLMFILIAEVLDTFINSLFIQLVKLYCAIKLSAQ